MKKLRLGVRLIAAAIVAAAIFCVGYQFGFERGDNNRIDRLHLAIQSIAGEGEWVSLGGSTSMGGGISVLTTDGCVYHELDASGNRIDTGKPVENKTLADSFTDVAIDDDPFP